MGLESVTTDRESGSRHKGVVHPNGNNLGSQFFILIQRNLILEADIIVPTYPTGEIITFEYIPR